MRFRTKQRPRGVLRATDQRRLTLMVVGIGLLLACFTIARRPMFWSWMFSGSGAPVVESEGEVPESVATYATTNTLNHDEVLIGNARTDVTEHSTLRPELADESAVSQPGIPRVPDDLLKSVKDDVIGIHSAEAEAYFASMKLAAKVEQRKELKAPQGSYALFMDSPIGSRGIAWHVEGQLRRLSAVNGGVNRFGVGTRYDGWITTPDSGDKLVHVVALKADKNLTRYIDPRDPARTVNFDRKNPPDVKFTGYFFKREGYASGSKDGISLAPLFLAGTIHEIPVAIVTSTRADELTPYLGWLAFTVCLGILFMIWSFATSDQAHSQTRAHQLTKLPAYAIFDDVSSITVSESLGNLQGAD